MEASTLSSESEAADLVPYGAQPGTIHPAAVQSVFAAHEDAAPISVHVTRVVSSDGDAYIVSDQVSPTKPRTDVDPVTPVQSDGGTL